MYDDREIIENLTSANTETNIHTNTQRRIQVLVESFEENVNWHEDVACFPGYLCGLHVGKGKYALHNVPAPCM
jgi:hypothetical protein